MCCILHYFVISQRPQMLQQTGSTKTHITHSNDAHKSGSAPYFDAEKNIYVGFDPDRAEALGEWINCYRRVNIGVIISRQQ